MIPLKDYNPTTRPIIFIPLLIGINVIVFLFVQPTFGGGSAQVRAQKQLEFDVCKAAIPFEVTHMHALSGGGTQDRLGRSIGAFQSERCPHKSVWLSILFSMFLHGGWLHIAGNMLFLWVFGNNVEDRLGGVRFLFFYLVCGLAATFAQCYVTPGSAVPLIGASGAIAGVLGAYLVMFPRARVRTAVLLIVFFSVIDLPAAVVLGLWFVLQIFQGVGSVTQSGGVAYVAHIAGFLTGVALLGVLRHRPKMTGPY